MTCRPPTQTAMISAGPARRTTFSTTLSGVSNSLPPILESQRPQRIPLDPGAEMHQRADKVSATYRQHLQALGLAYGVLPSPQQKENQ